MFSFFVHVPFSLVERAQNLVYFYYLKECTDKIHNYIELLFLDKKQLRRLDTGHNEDSQCHIDGYVLFNYAKVKYNKNDLNHFLERVIFYNLPYNIFSKNEPILKNHHDSNYWLNKVYKSLCLRDAVFRNMFEKVDAFKIKTL